MNTLVVEIIVPEPDSSMEGICPPCPNVLILQWFDLKIFLSVAELKIIANKKDVPYQSLAKIYLARQIALERSSSDISQGNNADR